MKITRFAVGRSLAHTPFIPAPGIHHPRRHSGNGRQHQHREQESLRGPQHTADRDQHHDAGGQLDSIADQTHGAGHRIGLRQPHQIVIFRSLVALQIHLHGFRLQPILDKIRHGFRLGFRGQRRTGPGQPAGRRDQCGPWQQQQQGPRIPQSGRLGEIDAGPIHAASPQQQHRHGKNPLQKNDPGLKERPAGGGTPDQANGLAHMPHLETQINHEARLPP